MCEDLSKPKDPTANDVIVNKEKAWHIKSRNIKFLHILFHVNLK
jgi:hypothetical protein